MIDGAGRREFELFGRWYCCGGGGEKIDGRGLHHEINILMTVSVILIITLAQIDSRGGGSRRGARRVNITTELTRVIDQSAVHNRHEDAVTQLMWLMILMMWLISSCCDHLSD